LSSSVRFLRRSAPSGATRNATKKSYFPEEMRGYYLAAIPRNRDEDGYFWIMGASDVYLKYRHRLGTIGNRIALVANPWWRKPLWSASRHDIKGEAIVAFVVLKGARPADAATAKELADILRAWVAMRSARSPNRMRSDSATTCQKTRSGKSCAACCALSPMARRSVRIFRLWKNPAILETVKKSSAVMSDFPANLYPKGMAPTCCLSATHRTDGLTRSRFLS